MEHINQLRAWKNQADKAGLDIYDEDYNVVLRLLNHALESHDKIESMQARIDELMLEYCHEEMTQDQITAWCKRQKPCTDPQTVKDYWEKSYGNLSQV